MAKSDIDQETLSKIIVGAIAGGVMAGSGGAILGALLGPAVIDWLKKQVK